MFASTGALCPALMTLCHAFWSYAIVCIMFGLFLSAWPAVTSSCLVSQLRIYKERDMLSLFKTSQ